MAHLLASHAGALTLAAIKARFKGHGAWKKSLPRILETLEALGAQAGTIYLCKAYNGGAFWAKAQRSQYSALIERIANVPDSLPLDQQVAIAEQQRSTAAQANTANTTTTTTTTTNTVTQNQTGADRQTECKALDAQIQQTPWPDGPNRDRCKSVDNGAAKKSA